jgi:hypothetical protein
MKSDRKGNTFNPHETARAQALAGVPLATFGQRFAAIAIDFFLVYAPICRQSRYSNMW